ncbi:hypothetical protein GCM10009734_86760 [Nonomuraea bangladeshensis]
MNGHQCTRSDAAGEEPWRCPDCGMLWEALPQQPAEHAEPPAPAQWEPDSPPWAEQPLPKGGVAVAVALVSIVVLPLFLQDWQPALAAVLAVLGLIILAGWFWLIVRK